MANFTKRACLLALALISACAQKPVSTIAEPTICELSDDDVAQLSSLSPEQQDEKFGHCDLSSFEKFNPVLTPERVTLINQQIAFELGLLGYNKRLLEEPVLTENIKGFQRSLGEPETGRLTQRQLSKAAELARKKSYFEVRLPLNGLGFKPNIKSEPDRLEFQGTWVVRGETLDGPYTLSDSKYNFWEFECEKSIQKCTSIHVNFGVSDDIVGIGRFENNAYDILSWDEDEVVLKNQKYSPKSCRNAIITVHIKDGDVTQKVTQQKQCRRLPDLKEPQMLDLLSTWEQAKKLNTHRLEQTLSVYTDDYMALKGAR